MSIQNAFRNMGLAIVLATVATAAMVVLTLDAMDEIVTISDRRFDSYLLADELRASSEGLTRNVRAYAVTSDPRFEKRYWEILDIRNGKKSRPADYAIAPGKRIALLTLMKQYGITDAELAKVAEANKKSDGLVALETEAMHLVKGLYKDSSGSYTVKGEPNNTKAMSLVFGTAYQDYTREIMQPFGEFFQLLDSRTGKEVAEISKKAWTYVVGCMLCLGVVFILIGIIFYYARKRVSVPLGSCCIFAEKVADGELEHRFMHSYDDEIGALSSALNRMVANLKERIQEADFESSRAREASELAEHAKTEAEAARRSAENAKRDGMFQAAGQLEAITTQVGSASEVLGVQIEQSSKGMFLQQQQAAETATAMDEMNASVLEVAHTASSAAENADKAKMTAVEGGEVVNQVIKSINRVDVETSHMKDGLDELGIQAEAIGQVINVITDIADQTNLLALNAAIEAARAGEAGRGFAVVADEVRKLAEKTMTATTEVSEAVRAIQKSSERNIEDMNRSAEAVQECTDLAGRAGNALAEIVEIIEGTASQVRTIATASEQQSAVSEEINRNTDEVSRIASETSEAMEQSVQAVDKLAALSGQLQSIIGALKSA